MITARHAVEAGWDVWAVPGPIGVPECRGSNRLLGDGAGVLSDVSEFVETIAPHELTLEAAEADSNAVELGEPLPEAEMRALRGVGFEPSRMDEISRHSGVGMKELLPALSMLELKGYVMRDAAGAFVRRGR